MIQYKKDVIVRKLQALTEGPTPLLHYVRCELDQISVHVQPWGPPMYLSWDQADAFTKEFPLPLQRKSVQPERTPHRKRRYA